ncbi:MAG: isopentenyl phosphate kinase [Promethearchaeota archaeon]
MNDLIFLKIGGSIITKKETHEPTIDTKNLKRICQEIADGYQNASCKLLIVHGAGSFGHPIVKQTGIHKGITRPDQLFSFAKTQLLQNILNSKVCQTLQAFQLPAIPLQPSATAIMENRRLVSYNYELVKSLIDLSLIPVLFGVPAFDKSQKCSILSGDQIVGYLAGKLNPQKIIFATNVDGILDKNQKLIERVTKDNFEEIQKYVYKTNYDDVTDSMGGKLSELRPLLGIKAYIINGTINNLIRDILVGKSVRGTCIEF